MSDKKVSVHKKALLVFIDIVDSSVLSSFLGMKKYAEDIIEYHNLFSNIADCYFPDNEIFNERIKAYRNINVRGDEGLIFIIDDGQKGSDLIIQALKLIFELKARLRTKPEDHNDKVPKCMRIAAGIHYGEVSLITQIEENRDRITEIIGYNINYAKRIESASRQGKFSNVFLSIEAANEIVNNYPLILQKHYAALKGIEDNEPCFEVQSFYFEDFPIGKYESNDKDFHAYFSVFSDSLLFIKDPWLKSFVISYLSKLLSADLDDVKFKKYDGFYQNILFDKLSDDDPIILFSRGLFFEKRESKYTIAINYYRTLVNKYPDFFYAIKRLILCSKEIITHEPKLKSEEIYIRDTIEELLNKFSSKLKSNETDEFKEVLRIIDEKSQAN